MYENTSFRLLTLSASLTVQETLMQICENLVIEHINAEDCTHVLENLLDYKIDLILFHTAIGEETILKTIEMIQRDDLYRDTPIIIVSDLKTNETLAQKLSLFPVISIFAYANWRYQVKSLLELLKCKMEKEINLSDNLIQTEEINFIDPLTGTLNRRGGEKQFESCVGYYASNKEPFSLVIFDIDFFKKVNDTYGHDVGDEVLVKIASIIKQSIRKEDSLIRFGGEEFMVFLSDCNIDMAKEKAESFRKKIESATYSLHELKITASFGVVEYKAGATLENLTKQADTLLYKAKAGGRNRVCSI